MEIKPILANEFTYLNVYIYQIKNKRLSCYDFGKF